MDPIRNIVAYQNPYPGCVRDETDDPTPRQRQPSEPWTFHLPAGIFGVCVALVNAGIAGATFPSLTVLSSPDEGIAIALAAGVLIAGANRFPLITVASQSLICVAVAAVPSLSSAALITGIRLGARSTLTVACVGAATLIFATSPWLPPGSRLSAPLVVLVPFAIGAVRHELQRRRQHRETQLLLSLQNAVLIEGRSAMRERERIADELHDRIGHRLTAIEIQARLVLERHVAPDTFEQKVTIMRTQANLALEDLRSIARTSTATTAREAPDALSAPTLEQQLREFAEAVEVDLDYSSDGSLDNLPPDLKYVVLRLFQEGVTNAARHAPGALVEASTRRSLDGIRVTIENPTTNIRPSCGGRGLPSLTRRFAQAGGILTYRLTAQRRFILEAFLPAPGTGARR